MNAEILTIPSNGDTVASSSLESGKVYRVDASGTYSYGGSSVWDAEWGAWNHPNGPNGGPQEDASSLNDKYDLWVNGTGIQWAGTLNGISYQDNTYSPFHKYRTHIVGTGGPATFRISDDDYGDNSGHLVVEISVLYDGDELTPTPTDGSHKKPDPVNFEIPSDSSLSILSTLEPLGHLDWTSSISEHFSETDPTVILTHGLESSKEIWRASDFAEALSRHINVWDETYTNILENKVNILAWDWSKQATWLSGVLYSLHQGESLGKAIKSLRDAGYSGDFHFIGHSAGSLVNKHAVDYLHSKGSDPSLTHVTIFDGPTTPSPIPQQAFWIENIVTEIGTIWPEATNIVLRRDTLTPNLGLGFLWHPDSSAFHSYALEWYLESIVNGFPPAGVSAGSIYSFERSGLDVAPLNNTYYFQTEEGGGGVGEQGLGTFEIVPSFEQAKVRLERQRPVLSIFQNVVQVYDLSGAIISEGNVQTYYELSSSAVAFSITLAESSPASAWVPVRVPSNSVFLDIVVKAEGFSAGDVLLVGLDGQIVGQHEGIIPNDCDLFVFGPLDLRGKGGKEVELYVGIVSDEIGGAILSLESLQFGVDESPPRIHLDKTEDQTIVSWSAGLLQQSDDLVNWVKVDEARSPLSIESPKVARQFWRVVRSD